MRRILPRFWTYILTNKDRSVLYTGMTNSMTMRLISHYIADADRGFATQHQAWYLVWCEETSYVLNAIRREKEIKSWRRELKEALINAGNPEWRFLNADYIGNWPPNNTQIAQAGEWMRSEATVAETRVRKNKGSEAALDESRSDSCGMTKRLRAEDDAADN